MNLFIPLPIEKRANKDECRKEIILAEKQMEKELQQNPVMCAICDKPLANRFQSASRFIKDSKEVHLHPVHIDCIEDNANGLEVMMRGKEYYDFSSLDLLLLSGIVNHLTDLEKEGKLPDLPDDDLISDMPSLETKGEPFYTMIEVIDGKETRKMISHIYENEQMPLFYLSKKVATQAKELGDQNNTLINYRVAGVPKKALSRMLNSDRRIMLVLSFEDTSAKAIPLTGQEIKDAMKSGNWLDKM